eukprot:scaffold17366_cov182-Amphora_coffeaeformis.AAC.2
MIRKAQHYAKEIQINNNDLNLALRDSLGRTIQHRKGKCLPDSAGGGIKYQNVEIANSPLYTVPVNTTLDLPKDLEKGDMTEVAGRKRQRGRFADNFFVLSGPWGKGKSCLELSVVHGLKDQGEIVLCGGLHIGEKSLPAGTAAVSSSWSLFAKRSCFG